MRAKAVLLPLLPAVALLALVLLALTVDVRVPGEGTGAGPSSGPSRGMGSGGGGGDGGSGRLLVLPCWLGYTLALGGGGLLAALGVFAGVRGRTGWSIGLLVAALLVAMLFWPDCGPTEPTPGSSSTPLDSGGGSGDRAPLPQIPPLVLWSLLVVLALVLLGALLWFLMKARGGGGAGRAAGAADAPTDGGAAGDGLAPLPETPRGAIIQAYVDAATALARAGHRRHPWETAREFAERVPGAPAVPMRELTALYERVRHGRVEPSAPLVDRARALAGLVENAAPPAQEVGPAGE